MSTIWDDEPAAMSTTCAVEHSNCPADCHSMTLLLKLVNLSADKYLISISINALSDPCRAAAVLLAAVFSTVAAGSRKHRHMTWCSAIACSPA